MNDIIIPLKNLYNKFNLSGNITFKDYISVILLMVSLIAMFMPHLYIKHSIYYKSVEINQLEKDFRHLKNENKILKIEYERLYFENNVKSVLLEEYSHQIEK